MTASDLVEVHLLDLPVPVAARTDEHVSGLHRDALIAASSEDDHHVPARLRTMVTALTADYAGFNDEPTERLERAVADGVPSLPDHVLRLPVEAAPAAQALVHLLDAADDYCSQGRHLLILAAPPDVVAYRHWYAEQVQLQLGGAEPVPWPESRQADSVRQHH